MEDILLMEGVRKGEEESFSILFTKYVAYVTHVVRGTSRGYLAEEDIEELVSDVFVVMWRKPPKVDREFRSIRYYLAGIARNKTNNLLRKKKINISPIEIELVVSLQSPDRDAIHKELSEILELCLKELGYPDNEIFIRHYYYNQKVEEISTNLDISQGTVKSKLSRGRVKLREYLERRGYYYEDITSTGL